MADAKSVDVLESVAVAYPETEEDLLDAQAYAESVDVAQEVGVAEAKSVDVLESVAVAYPETEEDVC